MKYTRRHQLGFSIVEIMIGMTLGLFLTTGIIQLYIGSNRNYRFQDAFAITQENGRFALELLNNSIRMTNFTGCSTNGANITVTNVLNNNAEWWKNIQNDPVTGRANWSGALVGYDGNQAFPGKAFGISTSADRIGGTDAIISLGGISSYSVVAADAQLLTLAQIQKINGGIIQKGNLLWICNVDKVALFQVTNVSGTGPFVITHANSGTSPGNSSNEFPEQPPLPPIPIIFLPNINNVYETEVTEYVPTAFYIGVSTSKVSRSLFQMQLNVTNDPPMRAEEMVEGVENMQIFYGEDITPILPPDQDILVADEYKDASGVADWTRVVSVRIELLLASIENNVLSEPQTYFFPNDTGDSAITGRTVIANDRRWYQTFSTTIGIRNRLN